MAQHISLQEFLKSHQKGKGFMGRSPLDKKEFKLPPIAKSVLSKVEPGVMDMIHVSEPVRKLGKRIIEKSQEGDGFLVDTFSKLTGRRPGEKDVKKLVENHGNATIRSITVGRTKIGDNLNKLLDLVSGGKFPMQRNIIRMINYSIFL